MRSLAKYAFINAKVRAKLGQFLSQKQIAQMKTADSLDGVYDVLRNTVYSDIFEKIDASYNIKDVELLLLKREIASYFELLKYAKGNIREIIFTLLSKYEVENLKLLLRLWHKKGEAFEEKLIYREKICHYIPIEKILKAENIEEIILLLEKTPYKKPIWDMRDRYKLQNLPFFLEVALDIDFYRRLWEKIDRLSGADRKIAAKLTGIEIDIQNINWVLRFKHYYNLPIAEIMNYLIPNGFQVTEDFVRRAYVSKDSRELLTGLLTRYYQRIPTLKPTKEIISNLRMLESILWQFLINEIKRALQGFPFTIGTIIAYLKMRKIEFSNIVSILNGKKYNLSAEKIEESLIYI